MVTPRSSRLRRASENRTVSRTWRTQYSGSRTSVSATWPVTVDTSGRRGSAKASSDTTVRSSASTGSMRGEWKAWLTRSRRFRRPSKRVSTSSTASSSPESTRVPGALTAAMATRSFRAGRTSSSVAARDTIAPPGGNAAISRPRVTTRRQASARENTPATWAAAISPTEWPSRKSAVTPHDSTSRYSATSRANSPAWVYSVWSSSGPPPNTSGASGRSRCLSSSAQVASKASAKVGYTSYRPRPIPERWAPCPENSRPNLPGSATPRTALGAVARSSRSALSRTTARCGNADLVAAREYPTSTRSAPLSSTWVRRRAACAVNASAERAESTHGTTGAGATASLRSGSSDHASRSTWALVPLIPNDETAARRGRPVSGQVRCSVSSDTAPASQSTRVDGSSTCRVLGSTPCRSAMTILTSPATPAAAWVWPMFDLIDPSHSGRSAGRSCP